LQISQERQRLFSTVIFILLSIAPIQKVKAEELETYVSTWSVVSSTLAAGDNPDAIAVGERTFLTITAAIAADSNGDGKISIHRIDSSSITRANVARFRCIGTTDDSSIVYDIWSGTLGRSADCEFTYLGTLTFTIGTQVSTTSTYEMADTLAVTGGEVLSSTSWVSASPENDRVAECAVDLLGDDTIVIVPTTVECDAKLLMKVL